jgi:hypothetical protein
LAQPASGPGRARSAYFSVAALLIVIFLCYGPVDFKNDRLLTSAAFWEWVLCLDCGVALWVLARRLRERGSQEV